VNRICGFNPASHICWVEFELFATALSGQVHGSHWNTREEVELVETIVGVQRADVARAAGETVLHSAQAKFALPVDDEALHAALSFERINPDATFS
jgi:hypothetical protein